MDNCGGHNESPEQQFALQQLNAVIRKLPKNSTHLCQLKTHRSYKRSSRCGQSSGSWKNLVRLSSVLGGLVRDHPASWPTLVSLFFWNWLLNTCVPWIQWRTRMACRMHARQRFDAVLDLIWMASGKSLNCSWAADNYQQHRAHFEGTPVPEEAEVVVEIVQDSWWLEYLKFKVSQGWDLKCMNAFFVHVYLKVFECSRECRNHIVPNYGIIHVPNVNPGITHCTIFRRVNEWFIISATRLFTKILIF